MNPPNDQPGAFDSNKFRDWHQRMGAGDGASCAAEGSDMHMEQPFYWSNHELLGSRRNTGGSGEIQKALDNTGLLREDTELASKCIIAVEAR